MTRICLTGATGFVGKNLLNHLSERTDVEVVALSRRLSPELNEAKKGNVTWRRCDGFSLIDTEAATKETDILIYLIHSMLPSASLSQGSFSDFDMYLADNFARAAKSNGIKKIIYLGGLIPDQSQLSLHLQSRLEVEQVLRGYGADLTTLRAGLIVGRNGSSFRILERLVRRLPLSICPSWTQSKTQPIDLQDVLASLEYTIDNYTTLKDRYDIGGPDIITYREMLRQTAQVLNRKRHFINVPLFSPALSKLWVSKVTSSSSNLVYPLVDSLKHTMLVNPEFQLKIPGHRYRTFKESLANGLSKESYSWTRTIIDYNANLSLSWLKNATSIQRVEGFEDLDAHQVAESYFNWLPWVLIPLIKVSRQDNEVKFYTLARLKFLCLLVLRKSEERSQSSNRCVFYVTGGLLANQRTHNGRLEFRYVKETKTLVMALLNFRPALPWFIYKYSQAVLHLFVMRGFGRYLKAKDDKHP